MQSHKKLARQAEKARQEHIRVTEILKPYGLTPTEWIVLGYVANEVSYTSSIASKLNTSLSFVTNTLNNLENKKWIVRTINEFDKRARSLHINPNKEKLIKRIDTQL